MESLLKWAGIINIGESMNDLRWKSKHGKMKYRNKFISKRTFSNYEIFFEIHQSTLNSPLFVIKLFKTVLLAIRQKGRKFFSSQAFMYYALSSLLAER